MIKQIYKVVLCAVLIVSCNNNENSGIENNLLEISKKLNALDPSVIQENQDSQSASKKISKEGKSAQKISFECEHTETYIENYNAVTYTSTISYFDENMNPTTNCSVFNEVSFLEYYTIEKQTTKGPDFEYDLSSIGTHKEELTANLIQSTYNQTITGTLNFDGSIFNILEGSYLNMFMSFEPDAIFGEEEPQFEEVETQIDIKYIFQFDANNTTYHFEMTLDHQDVLDLEFSEASELTMDYPLFNATNTQIGMITYVADLETDKEYFRLYDLEGNLVE